ncbi:MAG: hypothetical protein FWG87_07755 [Defluviitaleaceae bacterium]|nr:hypothetical protein [Defluviitaleaceae bacterium]
MRCCLRKPLRQHLTACLMDVTCPELTNVHTSGRINPSPTFSRHHAHDNRTKPKHVN